MPVGIAGLDSAVHTVNNKFRSLIAADSATSINCFPFGIEVSARTMSAAAFHIPTPLPFLNPYKKVTP